MFELKGPRMGRAAAVGLAAIAIFFIGFGGWAATAPLKSAVIASGVIRVESERKTIQHLEGGIVREILIQEGDRVSAGQPLIRLDATQSDASLELVRRRRDIAIARQARLEAQRDDRDEMVVPAGLLERRDEPTVSAVIATQQYVFRTQRESRRSQIAIHEMRREQLQSEITGLEGRIEGQNRELALLNEEINDLKPLVAKKIVPKQRLLALQRQASEVEGERSRNRAAILSAHQGAQQAKLSIDGLRAALINEAAAQLDEVQATILDLDERLRAAQDVRHRATVVAPQAGVVVSLRVHTTGGVVGPGEALLDLIPIEDRLIVDARIDPNDADEVRQGLTVEVRITSFNQRHSEPLKGRVTQVSADRLVNDRTGVSYYRVHVDLTGVGADVQGEKILPGMPAEVIINTGSRTLASYLLEPLAGVVRRAMRES